MKGLDFFAKIIETTPRKERKKKKKQQLCFAVFNRARTTKAIDTLFRLELVPNDTSSQLPPFLLFLHFMTAKFYFFLPFGSKKVFFFLLLVLQQKLSRCISFKILLRRERNVFVLVCSLLHFNIFSQKSKASLSCSGSLKPILRFEYSAFALKFATRRDKAQKFARNPS